MPAHNLIYKVSDEKLIFVNFLNVLLMKMIIILLFSYKGS